MAKNSNGYKQGGKTVGQKIMDMLGDGMLHTVTELRTCLWDDDCGPTALSAQIGILRKSLRPMGMDIVCYQSSPESSYRLVRHMASAINGKR